MLSFQAGSSDGYDTVWLAERNTKVPRIIPWLSDVLNLDLSSYKLYDRHRTVILKATS